MICICAGLQRRIEYAARGSSQLRVIGVGLHLDVGYSFNSGHKRYTTGRGGDGNSIHNVGVCTDWSARDRLRIGAVLIFIAHKPGIAHRRHVIVQLVHRERIAPLIGKFLNLIFGDELPLGGGRRVDQRSGGSYFNSLACGAHGQLFIDGRRLFKIDDNSIVLGFFEILRRDHNRVSSRLDRGKEVIACRVGARGARNLRSVVCQDNASVRNHSAGIIRDASAHSAIVILRINRRRDRCDERGQGKCVVTRLPGYESHAVLSVVFRLLLESNGL